MGVATATPSFLLWLRVDFSFESSNAGFEAREKDHLDLCKYFKTLFLLLKILPFSKASFLIFCHSEGVYGSSSFIFSVRLRIIGLLVLYLRKFLIWK